jgi:hypothetical protein
LKKLYRISPFIIALMLASTAFTQKQFPKFSLATDLGLQRSFKEGQRYYAGGHTVHAIFHTDARNAIYTWISYYSNGKFSNDVTATAKLPATTPQQINYRNNAEMRFKHISVGWRRFINGNYNDESGHIYGYAGFGILLGRVDNTHTTPNSTPVVIDTADYNVPVRAGRANFKRLTVDLGLGYEGHMGANIYWYAEGRAWIPASDYPSKYIFVNDNAPLVGMFNLGIRILFE